MPALPTAYTWSVGELVTAAKMNSYLRDAVTFLLARPFVRLRHSTTQTITTATATALNFDTEDDDSEGAHDTASNTNLITFQTSGIYTVTACGGWASNATGKRELWIRRNGTTTFGAQAFAASSSINHAHNVAVQFRAVVGDTGEVMVQQTSGGNLNIDNTVMGGQRFTALWERS